MKVSIKNNAQGGFTLIELIVVIVILGILAATALPKFASLGGDARLASLQAAKGALNATAAMAHGKYLVDPTIAKNLTFTVEGTTVNLYAGGYPKAEAATAEAAGMPTGTDYKVTAAAGTAASGNTAATGPSIKLVPMSLVGTTNETKCFVQYTESTTGAAPTIVVTGNSTDCN